MNPAYFSTFANHLWQSTLFAGVVSLLTLTLRSNRARVRHWMWLAALCKFLIPLSVLVALGGHMRWLPVPGTTNSNLSVVMDEVNQPFTTLAFPPAPVPAPPQTANLLPSVLWGIWACGFLGISCSWWVRWRQIRSVVHAASPVPFALPIRAMSSPAFFEPGVFGVFRPVLLLPEDIFDRLTPAQLNAVIAHELCHVRHRDNLAAAIQMFVETIFWFHPLVWWMGKRMVEERERACDEEVLRLGTEPRVYAEGILNVCKLYVESPLVCMSGVTGSNLKKRIAIIIKHRVVVRLGFAKRLVLAIAVTAALVVPIVVGMLNAPAIRAQSSFTAQSGARQRFEVVSVKACGPHIVPGTNGGGTSPGRVALNCSPLTNFIRLAYALYANGTSYGVGRLVKIEGGPAWINTELYEISAKAEGNPGSDMMMGPMMQAVLEDRFKLKIHRETREIPVYALVVAKAGLRLPAAKVGCIPMGPDRGRLVLEYLKAHPKAEDRNPKRDLPPLCGSGRVSRDGLEMHGATMADFCLEVSSRFPLRLDRRVIDKTGISGQFDFDLKWSPDDLGLPVEQGAPGASLPPDRGDDFMHLMGSLRKVGLQLQPAKGSGEFLVVDHAEKPSGN